MSEPLPEGAEKRPSVRVTGGVAELSGKFM